METVYIGDVGVVEGAAMEHNDCNLLNTLHLTYEYLINTSHTRHNYKHIEGHLTGLGKKLSLCRYTALIGQNSVDKRPRSMQHFV